MGARAANVEDYAPPLECLRQRDEKALCHLFDREDIEEIATDVTHNLFKWHPEPLWEDSSFDRCFEFLQEFL